MVINQQAVETPRPTYQEVAPPRALREHVLCFWRHGSTAEPTLARVIPDGCIDVVWVDDLPPHVAGPMTAPAVFLIGAGTEIVAVRFRPGVAHHLLGESARGLLDQDVPLRDLWPAARAARWAEVAGHPTSAKPRAIAETIAAHLGAASETDDFVARVARWMARHPNAPVDELAHHAGLGERQLRRRFDEAIGYGPKRLQRILRLQRLLWLAGQERGAGRQLVALAYAAGYADQPHMTREVLALTGVSPAAYLQGTPRSAVSEMFKTPTP